MREAITKRQALDTLTAAMSYFMVQTVEDIEYALLMDSLYDVREFLKKNCREEKDK